MSSRLPANVRWRGLSRAPGPAYMCVGWIYFIQAKGGGPIKIGLSRNPQMRLRTIQMSHPEKLVLRRVIPVHDGTIYRAEKQVHKMFAEYRLRGEWFRAAPELADIADAIPDAA